MTGLAQVFAAHISSRAASDPEYLDQNDKENDVFTKLVWIPSYVLKCYAFPEMELKFRVLQVRTSGTAIRKIMFQSLLGLHLYLPVIG